MYMYIYECVEWDFQATGHLRRIAIEKALYDVYLTTTTMMLQQSIQKFQPIYFVCVFEFFLLVSFFSFSIPQLPRTLSCPASPVLRILCKIDFFPTCNMCCVAESIHGRESYIKYILHFQFEWKIFGWKTCWFLLRMTNENIAGISWSKPQIHSNHMRNNCRI